MGYIKLKREDVLFSRLVRYEQNWTCERCGAKHEIGSRGLHASHFIGRSNGQVRWDRDNVDVLCWGCHQYMETYKGTQYREWKIKKLGKKRFQELVEKSREIKKITKADKKKLASQFHQELKKWE